MPAQKNMRNQKMKSLLTAALVTMMAPWTISEAAGNIWTDEAAVPQVKAYKQIVVFPVKYPDNSAAPQKYDEELVKRIKGRIKRIKIVTASNDAVLGKDFADESQRAAAVAATGADAYLVPEIRVSKDRIDHSPAAQTAVRIEEFDDIYNGPYGSDSMLRYHSWYTDYLIPPADNALKNMDVTFSLYDAHTGKPALTLIDYYRTYNVSEEHAFSQIAKNFTGDWSRLRSSKVHNDKNGMKFYLDNLTLPAEGLNDFDGKTIAYAYCDEAQADLKKVNFLNAGQKELAQYEIKGTLTDYTAGETWSPPSVLAEPEPVWSHYFIWRDRDGHTHEGRRVHYETRITPYSGRYAFWYHTAASLFLLDSRTGKVLMTRQVEAADKERYANALRKMFKSFYKDVNKFLTEASAKK